MKKLFALCLSLVLALGLATSALAAGTNSITVTGAKTGEKYNIYKMLDLSVALDADEKPTSYRYTINDTWKDFWTTGAGKDYIDTNTAGSVTYVVWKSDKQTADDMEAFGKAAAAWAKDNNIAADAKEETATADGAKFEELDNGYYLVTSTYGIAASVASTPANPEQEIKEKNKDNSTEKKVQEAAERNGTAASWGSTNDAAIGDTITFRAKVSIAKNSVKVVYHDTMGEALTWTGAENVKVYTDEDCTTELAAANYSVAAGTGSETFTVSFTDIYVAGLTAATTDVYVKYTAVLNDKAVVDTGVKNEGQVKWGENGETTKSETETKTHSFEILKYDGTDTEKSPLAGAKFVLHKTEADENDAVVLAVSGDKLTYRVVNKDEEIPSGYTKVTDNKIETLATGKIKIEGVDSDDYWLEETDAPLGYNKLENRVKVQVNAENSIVSDIANNSGTVLPSTGGIGTTIFYIVGGILVLGAGVLLITKKRMTKEG